MSYSLLIVDMQHYFTASRGKRVQLACLREIKKAIRDKAPILFVEYANCGPTLPLLTDVVKTVKYKRSYVVTKNDMDGSWNIMDFLNKRHLPKMNLRCCGVNTDACVEATVEGITHNYNSNVHVVADACATDSGYHKDGLTTMQQYPNVKLLRAKKWIK